MTRKRYKYEKIYQPGFKPTHGNDFADYYSGYYTISFN